VEMRAEIKRLHQASGITSVYVTHDQVEAMTLGSRIAVMKGGVVQQLGTPDEIYNHPANTYVATFIGSPTMNLLRGTATGGQFGIQGAALDLAPPSGANEVLLGVRPEHLVMQDNAAWRGKVSVVEPTGPDTYVMVDTAAGTVTLRTDAQTRVQPGDLVGLSLAPAHAHWFDVQSQERMAA
ncbi:MAG: ABC transporter ATP-binding protein, partial [Acidovorax sp.]|nr:ABC transporter ATP-binding protein [Acidovorax sp.]